MMHLGWFVGRGFSVHGWKQDWWGDDFRDWTSADIYLDLARALDRACFDYVMIEDGSLILLSEKLWASEVIRRIRPALEGQDVEIRLAS